MLCSVLFIIWLSFSSDGDNGACKSVVPLIYICCELPPVTMSPVTLCPARLCLVMLDSLHGYP